MIMKNDWKIGLACCAWGALALTQSACSDSGSDEPVYTSLQLTVSAKYEPAAQLSDPFVSGDKLLAIHSTFPQVATLTMKSGSGTSEASFSGAIQAVPTGTSLRFVGVGGFAKWDESSRTVQVDLSQQDGTMAGLSKTHLLMGDAAVTVTEGDAAAEGVVLKNQLVVARYRLALPEGVSAQMGTLSISDVPVKASFNVTTGQWQASEETGVISVPPLLSNTDLYLYLVPGKTAPTFTFQSTQGRRFIVKMAEQQLSAGTLLANADGSALPVPCEEKYEEVNRGLTVNWGGNVAIPAPKMASTITKISDTGFAANLSSDGRGGFATPITFTSNGIIDDLLSFNEHGAFLYQWGRWVGFPGNVGDLFVDPTNGFYATGEITAAHHIPGIDINDNRFGYVDNAIPGFCLASTQNREKTWSKQDMVNYSLIHAKVSNDGIGDYMAVNDDCTYEDRCGNPCPQGYRIPTAEELGFLIPEKNTAIIDRLAQVRTIDGMRIAMEWRVTKAEVKSIGRTVPCLEIRSVPTQEETIAPGDPIFNSAKVVRLYALGYLCNAAGWKHDEAPLWKATYWSSSTGKSTKNECYGICLEVDFTEELNKATMGLVNAYRSFSMPILPIRDVNAKPTPIQPWVPLTGN